MTRDEPRIEVKGGDIDAVLDMNASPQDVYAAISDPQQIMQWWGADNAYKPTNWRCDLRVGGRWRSEGVAPGGQTFFVEGEYLAIEPHRVLEYTWNVSWMPLPTTRVRWELTPIATGTRVRVKHTGFGANTDAARSHSEERSGGWAAVLIWLNRYLKR